MFTVYTFCVKPSLLIIGLGNPGKEYVRTRHNAGFIATNLLATEFGTGDWKPSQKFLSSVHEARIVTVPVLLVQPDTYMNRSGEAAKKLVDFYKLDPRTQVIVLLDDIDIPLGELRLRQKGSAGTHNGLKSIVDCFGEEVPRLRIGIGPKPEKADLASWVLSAFSDDEQKLLKQAIGTIPAMIKDFVMGE